LVLELVTDGPLPQNLDKVVNVELTPGQAPKVVGEMQDTPKDIATAVQSNMSTQKLTAVPVTQPVPQSAPAQPVPVKAPTPVPGVPASMDLQGSVDSMLKGLDGVVEPLLANMMPPAPAAPAIPQPPAGEVITFDPTKKGLQKMKPPAKAAAPAGAQASMPTIPVSFAESENEAETETEPQAEIKAETEAESEIDVEQDAA